MDDHLLVIFPHPDDEAFGVSGTIAQHTKKGLPVTYICLTLGQMGRNMGNPPFATRESLPLIRQKELEDACAAVGIQDLRQFGFRDKTVEFEDEKFLADQFLAVIDEVKPTRIITFYPGYSVHPDHEATARAVVRAVGSMPEMDRPELLCVAFAKNSEADLGAPHVVTDISDVFEEKMNCIKAHRSQTQWLVDSVDKDPAMLAWVKNERFWRYPF
ncbi:MULTISPECIES: bacillithiol biosynthesis deacetylase BshB2 [Fictibacillus]|uniref:bacillithiol biosynthesis deacetylase BshB2 n=1 Tax=Fictibacillus TaxID=1329200 RepID=UPI0018CE96DD|nr:MULTISPECIES: bacillithiol biosynthesis deacetylase BshB2 [unclassified Fictibacillus]MBH0163248.1 bacillithiol biosynthesis deacetylase BshB2 [Fictibacillus sp. 26RED30]MBH0166945.1 bacillithiol biosynthesis deacetylase BshB2 [Fictibacillus sp. 7GRE50]MBH0174958.1 bacillithiol biosynthesis deacetylase BshB2 [Fictibacillus sp. 23RED33]